MKSYVFFFVSHTVVSKNKEIHFAFVATDQENDLTAHLIKKDHYLIMSPALSFNVFFFLQIYIRSLMSLECFFVYLVSKGFISRVQSKIRLLMLLHLFLFSQFSLELSLCVFVQVSPSESELHLFISFVHK